MSLYCTMMIRKTLTNTLDVTVVHTFYKHRNAHAYW